MWQNITVEQYQRIYAVSLSDIPAEDKSTQYLSIILNKTPREVEDMSIMDYNKKSAELAKLFEKEIPGKAKRYIKANGKLFRVNYEVSTMRFAQYVEAKTFIKDGVVPNLHFLMASVVDPVKDYVVYRKPLKNTSETHEQRANDLLQAKFIDCHHAALFFCKLYTTSIKSLSGFLERELLTAGMTKSDAEVLKMFTDGCLAQLK